MKITFIGLGNMATAMIGGILGQDAPLAGKNDISGADPSAAAREKATACFGISVYADNSAAVSAADIIILAIKPQYAAAVLEEIRDHIPAQALILSIMAGKSMYWIIDTLTKSVNHAAPKIIRAMPNLPALVGAGMSGVCRNDRVSDTEMALALRLLSGFGQAEEIPESLIDAVVGVSGSSPAYVFIFIEALADAAVAAGMPRDQALRFAAQAVLGSARTVLETGKHPAELKDMVCSPGGTTIEAVRALEEKGFRAAVLAAAHAAVEKSRRL